MVEVTLSRVAPIFCEAILAKGLLTLVAQGAHSSLVGGLSMDLGKHLLILPHMYKRGLQKQDCAQLWPQLRSFLLLGSTNLEKNVVEGHKPFLQKAPRPYLHRVHILALPEVRAL